MQVGKILSGITVRGEGVGAAGDMRLLLNETLIGTNELQSDQMYCFLWPGN